VHSGSTTEIVHHILVPEHKDILEEHPQVRASDRVVVVPHRERVSTARLGEGSRHHPRQRGAVAHLPSQQLCVRMCLLETNVVFLVFNFKI